MSFVISFGKFGGFYLFWGYTKRVCLGWVAFTFFPLDIDPVLDDLQKLRKLGERQ